MENKESLDIKKILENKWRETTRYPSNTNNLIDVLGKY